MSPRVKHWLHGLGAAFIGGAATPISTQTGIAFANMVGVHINFMDAKQAAAVALSSALVATAAYLKQSPLPPESTGQTEVFQKPKDE